MEAGQDKCELESLVKFAVVEPEEELHSEE
jgi:hypothetical protein